MLGAALLGGPAGAGIALGAWYQPTSANIHSGYAFKDLGDALYCFSLGGVLGMGTGFVLGCLATKRRCAPGALGVLVALALAGVVGWNATIGRPTIDCDENVDYCAQHSVPFP